MINLNIERLREIREDNDYTQQQIADILKCDVSLYSKYERGEREVPVWIVIELAKFYNTSTDYILNMTSKK